MEGLSSKAKEDTVSKFSQMVDRKIRKEILEEIEDLQPKAVDRTILEEKEGLSPKDEEDIMDQLSIMGSPIMDQWVRLENEMHDDIFKDIVLNHTLLDAQLGKRTRNCLALPVNHFEIVHLLLTSL